MDPPPPPPPRQAKPSPHRFLTKKKSSNTSNNQPLRPSYGPQPTAPSPSAPPPTPRTVPRFATSSTEHSTQLTSTQSSKPRFSLRTSVEDQLEASSEDELPPTGTHIYPTTEQDHAASRYHDQSNEEPYSKRRRVEEDIHPTETSPRRPNARFLSQAAAFPSSEPIASSKPSFLRSSLPSHAIDPSPEFFSPHRRGQRFVPGGMAAEMQSWITELGTSTASRRADVSGFSAVLEVEQIEEDGVLLLEARTSNGSRVSAMLESKPGITVRQGDRLGIRDPTWEMDPKGNRVLVGVDWQVVK
ncbi:hypothetical protein BDZ85DRAFT_95847 [Elsinoe ampelina]|uniref:Uncharacterized protein n=1 Tax=Elsinoe ampelina TaxID=302913 RepID=A0A6A6GE56_9PEZI|nr:hypothetical protein BDZ85DRAFT_95847 [Elsinoe ampelina]